MIALHTSRARGITHTIYLQRQQHDTHTYPNSVVDVEFQVFPAALARFHPAQCFSEAIAILSFPVFRGPGLHGMRPQCLYDEPLVMAPPPTAAHGRCTTTFPQTCGNP